MSSIYVFYKQKNKEKFISTSGFHFEPMFKTHLHLDITICDIKFRVLFLLTSPNPLHLPQARQKPGAFSSRIC